MNRETILENRRKWLEALRSGDYQQGRQVLHNREANTYCCLGVACHIAGISETEINYRVNDGDDGVRLTVVGSFAGNPAVLPLEGSEWLGVRGSNPDVLVPGMDAQGMEVRSVAELNDAGYSFEAIADLIETYGFTVESDLLRMEAVF